MALVPTDEYVHEPRLGIRWQENCFLVGWDDEHRFGFYVHVERFADTGQAEVKTVVFGPAGIASVSESHRFGGLFDLPGFELAVVEPFSELRLRLDVKGHGGDTGWLAPPGPGAVPIGVDAVLRNTLPPFDWRRGFEQFGIPGVEGSHYEVGGTWTGEIVVGSDVVAGSGLFVRDHSWGPRDLRDFSIAWWTPMVFDGGSAMISGISFLHRGHWKGITLVGDGGAVEAVPHHQVDPAGSATPRGYGGATVLAARDSGEDTIRVSATARVHAPVEYPGFGPGYYMNDALCRCEWEHRQGFGLVELNRRHGVAL